MNTTRPVLGLVRKAGRATLSALTSEKKLTSKWRLHASSGTVGSPIRVRGSSVPALRIRPSRTGPNLSFAWPNACAWADSSVLQDALCRRRRRWGHADSHVTRDGEERCRMGVDELGQRRRPGSCERDDTGVVLFEERFDDGESNTSGRQSAQSTG